MSKAYDAALAAARIPPDKHSPVLCRICSRVLKHPASIKARIGPECAEKNGVSREEIIKRETEYRSEAAFDNAQDVGPGEEIEGDGDE